MINDDTIDCSTGLSRRYVEKRAIRRHKHNAVSLSEYTAIMTHAVREKKKKKNILVRGIRFVHEHCEDERGATSGCCCS